MKLDDGLLERLLWRAFRGVDVLGSRRARQLAVLLIGLESRAERGYAKSIYRVARHTSSARPDVVGIPERWSSESPLVRVRRLGVTLDLDLRDNLRRVLYYTGTYEPGVVRLIAREPRRGDGRPSRAVCAWAGGRRFAPVDSRLYHVDKG